MGDSYSFIHDVTLLLIAGSTAAIIVIAYHCFNICWYNRALPRPQLPANPVRGQTEETPASTIEISVARLIPAHKYHKKGGGGPVAEDAAWCTICLCEFDEGEELRTLPECLHSFHVSCIDMWLYSHSTCPVCRTDTTNSPTVSRSFSYLGGSTTREQNHNVAPNLGLHLGVL